MIVLTAAVAARCVCVEHTDFTVHTFTRQHLTTLHVCTTFETRAALVMNPEQT